MWPYPAEKVRSLKNSEVIFCAAGVLSVAAAHTQPTVTLTTTRRSALFKTKARCRTLAKDRCSLRFGLKVSSSPEDFHPRPLSGRVEDWRAGLGRSLCSLFLALSFASVTLSRPCHVSSPRHVERSVRISRTALSCLLHLKGYGTYRAGATFGVSHRTL
jgi:hypothetical protein